MSTFSKALWTTLRFLWRNPNLSVFALGFAIFSAALASYSLALSGAVGGLILMGISVYPFLSMKVTRDQ